MQMDGGRCGMGSYTPLYHPHHQANVYGCPDDQTLLARAEAAAMSDFPKSSSYHFGLMKAESLYGGSDLVHHSGGGGSSVLGGNGNMGGSRHQLFHGFAGESMLDQLTAVSMPIPSYSPEHSSCMSPYGTHPSAMYNAVYTHSPGNGMMHSGSMQNIHLGMSTPHHSSHSPVSPVSPMASLPHPAAHELDCDPRELEAFAEHFKQRRIKLGVTQADVGSALGKLKIPGVGALSQSTICRFESLTLSHNNMIALKPVLHTWLEAAERSARQASVSDDSTDESSDKKKKRTSITAAEKRSLEAYFAIQPRPSGEKIAQIAEKLGLKKGVVRVWFCNQRQKQKRMKFASSGLQTPSIHQLR